MTLIAACVRRPVAGTLLAAGTVLGGVLAYVGLPVASLPSVERPTIAVQATLPGASAQTVSDSLAQPLERALGVIPGILEMSALNTPGATSIQIQFTLGTDLDAAAGEVQAALNAAAPNLPKTLPAPPVYHRANASGPAAIVLALTSDELTQGALYDLADAVVVQQVSRLPGVALAVVSGADRSGVRIDADPGRLAGIHLSLEEVRAAVHRASVNLPEGSIGDGNRTTVLGGETQLFDAASYRDVVVSWRDGAPVRLGDVAQVSDGPINAQQAGWFGRHDAALVRIYKQPSANVVALVDSVTALLPHLRHSMPAAAAIHIAYDRTLLIREAVRDLERSIGVIIALVSAAALLFLRRADAALVAALGIPVAIAATLAGVAALGYSLDNLSLIAMTIAVGLVVDDAIIVVENILRWHDSGVCVEAAAIGGTRQIAFTILSVSAVLVATCLPVLFMPDIVGRYMRELGMTVIIAVLASGLLALTLTPMLCRQLLRRPPAQTSRPFLLDRYERSLRTTLRAPWLMLLLVAGLTLGSAWLYARLPKGFMPLQDTGVLSIRTVAPSNVSYAMMYRLQLAAADAVLSDPATADLVSFIGSGTGSAQNNGSMLVNLRPFAERPAMPAIVARLRKRLAAVSDIRGYVTPVQDLNFGGQSAASRFQFTLIGLDAGETTTWGLRMLRGMRELPDLTGVLSNIETIGLQQYLTIDRVRAASLGILPSTMDDTMYDALGQRQILTIFLPHNYSRVVLEADPAIIRGDPASLATLYVPAAGRENVMLPLFAQAQRQHGAMWVAQEGVLPSVTLSFDTAPGASLGQAVAAIRRLQASLAMPSEIRGQFRGEAEQAERGSRLQLLLFLAAMACVYVILGILYESFLQPLVVLSVVAPATIGAVLALRITGTEFTLITGVACILLVGMVLKNSIMLVDFAVEGELRDGLTPLEAVVRAARLRLRPILATSTIAILGALPLALVQGPGVEIHQPLGITIGGGLLVSQLVTLYTTPSVYLLISCLRRDRRARLR